MNNLRYMAVAALCFFVLSGASITSSGIEIVQSVQAASCNAGDNLGETAQAFISKCRKGKINSEFPGEMYSKKIGDIKKGKTAVHKKAWKLLNDNRFKK